MSPLKIAPIGTCRIHTPLRSGVRRYPFRVELGRNYGYVHTSPEALQQLRFMFGEVGVPAAITKLVMRSNLPVAFDEQVHRTADLYLIEISSRKLVTVDGVPIQLNYATRYFSDFFADRARTRMFWSMASDEQHRERETLLVKEPAFQRLSVDDRALLSSIHKRELKDADIERDMTDLAERIGAAKLVFVTHVNANTPDNQPIEARQRLINAVRASAKRIGIPCYNPTPLMREIGQILAMENDGLDLTHYSDLFADRLAADWNKRFVAPRIGIAEHQEAGIITAAPSDGDLAEIEAGWAAGQLIDASRRLRAALRRDPRLHHHRLLLGRMQFELGDYEGATANLESARDELGPNDKADIMLMRAYFRIGEYAHARRFATALLSDETETVEIVRTNAMSSIRLGDAEAALSDWMRLFQISADKAEAASAVLGILSARGNDAAVARWAEEVLELLPDHAESFAALWRHRVAAGDRTGLLDLARQAVPLGDNQALDLAELAADRGFATPAALLMATLGLLASKIEPITEWIGRQAAEWLQRGIVYLEQGQLFDAADTLQARAQLRPTGNALTRARRTLEQQLRRETRLAFAARDFVRVVQIIETARQTLTTFPELDSFLGRACDALGDTETALIHLQKVADEEGAPLSARMQLARVAVRGERYLEALDAYWDVLQSPMADEPARAEAKRQLLNLEGRSIRSARKMVMQGQHDQAWTVLDRLERTNPDNLAVRREKDRVLSDLRTQVRGLSTSCSAERLNLGEAILRLDPRDEVGLKAAAIGAMRLHNFNRALHYWEELRKQSDNPVQIDANIQKCALWVERTRRKEAA